MNGKPKYNFSPKEFTKMATAFNDGKMSKALWTDYCGQTADAMQNDPTILHALGKGK